jgi:hypothetical protein
LQKQNHPHLSEQRPSLGLKRKPVCGQKRKHRCHNKKLRG